ncbi:hypothetical protein NPIL_388501 [Nephila pilipes]|uniref:Uncharacterized protein n=1 Tax=Nephila pilipes TaxID=299642 RepID=A0A8X6QIK3_NEPPI|nr:hypothetical protein NPIL_388501 [Nephila pilipes]
MLFPKFLTLLLLFGGSLSEGIVHPSSIEGSHGCGPHPALEIIKSIMDKHRLTLKEVLKIIEKDEDVQQEVSALIGWFDNCMRLDGIRYRRSQQTEVIDTYDSIYKKISEILKEKREFAENKLSFISQNLFKNSPKDF